MLDPSLIRGLSSLPYGGYKASLQDRAEAAQTSPPTSASPDAGREAREPAQTLSSDKQGVKSADRPDPSRLSPSVNNSEATTGNAEYIKARSEQAQKVQVRETRDGVIQTDEQVRIATVDPSGGYNQQFSLMGAAFNTDTADLSELFESSYQELGASESDKIKLPSIYEVTRAVQNAAPTASKSV